VVLAAEMAFQVVLLVAAQSTRLAHVPLNLEVDALQVDADLVPRREVLLADAAPVRPSSQII
jgi:hypothetical protein